MPSAAPKSTKLAALDALTCAGLTPIGLSREMAAAYLGVGIGVFDSQVKAGALPQPVQMRGRLVWRRVDLDRALARLPDVTGVRQAVGDGAAVVDDVFSHPKV